MSPPLRFAPGPRPRTPSKKCMEMRGRAGAFTSVLVFFSYLLDGPLGRSSIFQAVSMAISGHAPDPARYLAPALPHEILLQLLSDPCLLPRHLAQARLVCQSWARAVDETITIVRLGSLPPPPHAPPARGGSSRGGSGHAACTASQLFARLARLPSLECLWLGPAVVRATAMPHHHAPSISSGASGCHPFHSLALSPSLISLRLQPDAQEAFALPQVRSCH